MHKIDKIYIVFDEADEPCIVTDTKSSAQSYINWFLDKNKKYYIKFFLVDRLKITQEEVTRMLKEFSP